MLLRRMLVLFKWIVALGLILAACSTVAYWVNGQMRSERAREGEEDKVQSPRRTKDGVVNLGTEEPERSGSKGRGLRGRSRGTGFPVYGQVVRTRGPWSRFARPSPARCGRPRLPWPAPGRGSTRGRPLGWIDIRIAAQERLALQDNLNNARLKKQGRRSLCSFSASGSDRIERSRGRRSSPASTLDDAKVLLADAETQLAIATAAVELWRKALEEVDRPGNRESTTTASPCSLRAMARSRSWRRSPGMSIEAGGLVARVVDSRRVLVRLDMPPELLASGPPPRPCALTASRPARRHSAA